MFLYLKHVYQKHLGCITFGDIPIHVILYCFLAQIIPILLSKKMFGMIPTKIRGCFFLTLW